MSTNNAATPTGDPWLLTPGPLTTSVDVKAAMGHDYGSRDTYFIALNRRVRERLLDIVNAQSTHVCVPLQGSGTFVVEAMLGCFVPRDGKVLILVNGAYGQRMSRMCEYLGRGYDVLETPEDTPCDAGALDRVLNTDSTITHVAVIQCETTSGILNPVETLAEVSARHQRGFLIDAMSAFGAVALDARTVAFDALVASSNKCLEGAPGMGFCIARQDALEKTAGNSHSLSLDLHDQWVSMESSGQWRFTPPTHIILAFDRALEEFAAEGGVIGRHSRYAENCRILVEGMRGLGFKTLLPDELQAPIIVTFHTPSDPKFDFETFYDGVRHRGYVIYPGKLTVADSFRVGCIGRLGASEIEGALAAMRETLADMGVASCEPDVA